MQRFPFSVVFVGFFMLSLVFAGGLKKRIVGYYPVWRYRDPDNPVKILDIPYEKLTHINFAFFTVFPDGRIAPMDTLEEVTRLVLDGVIERGQRVSLPGVAHRNGVKVLASIGGWEDSEYFSFVARSKRYRENFAKECIKLVKRYDFDGVDIDWEYPGYVPHNGIPEDRENFTLLMREIRNKLDTLSMVTGRYYELTAALPASRKHLQFIELGKIDKIIDFHNVMTYDYYGVWDSLSNFNSPLFPSSCGDGEYCIDGTFKVYTEDFGIAPDRINIGIPFYGRAFAGCTGPCMPHSGVDTVLFNEVKGYPIYRDLIKRMGEFVRYWDDDAEVPYLVNEKKRVFVTYEDEKSVLCKARYVSSKGIGGVIIWEITLDCVGEGKFPLLDVIYREFEGKRGEKLKRLFRLLR